LDGTGYAVVGFGWQTDTLAGETICSLIDSGSGDTQLYIVQNADGSLSLWSGLGPTLLGTSPAGTITAGVFWYIELNTQLLLGYVGPVQAILTVTTNAAPGQGIATQVLNVTNFATSQQSWDTLTWGGPVAPHHAWVADFYCMAVWDGFDDPLSVLGAPKIFGQCVPQADGLDYVVSNTIGKTEAFPGTGAPWWSQVNGIPQSTAAPIFETDESVSSPGTIGGWIDCGQGFQFDVSSVPVGSVVAAVQATILYAATAGDNRNQSALAVLLHYTGFPPSDFGGTQMEVINLAPNTSIPFAY
jgi:hypothetical protein